MIKSMTGFGRSEVASRLGSVFCEMRSVNHRYLDISMKLPEGCGIFESKIRERLQKKIRRGRVDMVVAVDAPSFGAKEVGIDRDLANKYIAAINELKRNFRIKGEPTIGELLMLPNIIKYRAAPGHPFKLWPLIEKAIDKAEAELSKSRRKEGGELFKDILSRANKIGVSLNKIKGRSPMVVERYRKTLERELKQASSNTSADMEHIEKEVAVFARSCDISEEVTRMQAHLRSFTDAISKNSAEVGKRLDFISQELHREANTIGSKANDARIQDEVIEIKSQIEKIREQVQNVE